MTPAAGDALPLAGRCVLVTRPRAQADVLVQQLESAGATVVIAPTVQIVPPDNRGPLLKAAADPSQFDWIVFASANAVDAFLSAAAEATDGHARAGQQLRMAGGGRFAAVGTRTAERLRSYGIEVDLVPDEFRAEALVAAIRNQGAIAGARVLLPRSDIGRDAIAEGLSDAGAIVTAVVAYRTVAEPADGSTSQVKGMLVSGDIDAVMFTSGSAVRHFVQVYGPESVELLGRLAVAAIGPVTAEAARDLGIAVDVQPATYTTAAMVAALAAHFATRST